MLAAGLSHAEVTRDAMPETGLKRWMLTEGPLKLELIQRLPDQTRGFFSARSFNAAQADDIAVNGCVFQTIGTNTSADEAQTFEMDLAQWRMRHNGKSGPIKLKSDWDAAWGDDVSQAARVAFRWATFPTSQVYAKGDYNWGMTTYGIPPGESFDLEVVWKIGGKEQRRTIDGIECAPDTDQLTQ